jgi:serine protease AprX
MRFLRPLITPKGKRFLAALIVTACAAALAASATGGRPSFASPSSSSTSAYVPANLLSAARANPSTSFRVILQGTGARAEAHVVSAVHARGAKLDRTLRTISGAAATVTGRQLQQLASAKGVAAISLDRPVKLAVGPGGFTSTQQWPLAADAQKVWGMAGPGGTLPTPPAIAIVDSGIQSTRPDFGPGRRVLQQVSISSGVTTQSQSDAYGHGTFVAGIAAGSATGYAGVAPTAPLVSIDVMNSQGMALTSDVIASCDWIIRHKDQYNIRVANFSLHSTAPASIFWDPLDQAVEKLWFDGVTVVTAAGNNGTGSTPSGLPYAPANDPFVITVGADDLGTSAGTGDDTAAPWSGWGYTFDGFAKPDIAAPGRYLIGPAPVLSTLTATRPDAIVAPGYLQLSGTSFAAPVVSGAAAEMLALHPNWTPDQVKGALMLSAQPLPAATPGSLGVGLVDVWAATQVTTPPNPNLALDQFVGTDPNGGSLPVFNTSAWQATALANPTWDTAAWGSAAWGSAAWGSAAWGSAAWGSAAWGSAAWGSAAWGSSALAQQLASGDAAWGSAAWGSAAWGSLAVADIASDKP